MAHPAPLPARPAGHIGPAPSTHAGAPAARSRPVVPTAPGNYYGNPGSLFPPPGITSTRPVYYTDGIARYGNETHRDRRRGYGGVGFLALGYPGDLGLEYDPDFLDPTYNPNTAQDAFPASQASAAPPQGAYESPEGYVSEREPEQAPPPDVAAPEPRRMPEPKPLPEEDAVTIIFKDGRPSEQIRNYALTRTALYVTSGRVRTIPIEQIDIPATEKLNEKAGVDFHLPSGK